LPVAIFGCRTYKVGKIPVNSSFLKALRALRNAELSGFASLAFGSLGASRLANQTFDWQNLLHNQPLSGRYAGEPASQLGISQQKEKI